MALSMITRAARNTYATLFPISYKQRHELGFWKSKLSQEGSLSNDHYVPFYTSYFGLDKSLYNDKRILDIGCGPRGSLEWADMASERIGLDPLANEYLKLGADQHQMTYVASPSEKIPFSDGYFDAVFSFNSLDHVSDVHVTISEIKRITKPKGLFLLIVEVNHPPTKTEPISLPWEITESFTDSYHLIEERRYEIGDQNIYRQLAHDARFDASNPTKRSGILAAKFIKHG